jgi:hypothetical protein
MKAKRIKSGRPPKFLEPRHPVTMTLPDRILDHLARIDPDRALAVVKVTEAAIGTEREDGKAVESIEIAHGKSLIVVGLSKALRDIPWLKFIEIGPTRYLLAIPTGTAIEVLEVALRDLIHRPEFMEDEHEMAILNELVNFLGHKRRARHLSKAEILIVESE